MQAKHFDVGDLIGGSLRVLRVFGGAGASGMGVVYLVDDEEDPENHEPYVLKACQSDDAAGVAQFKREAEVWVSIGVHPHVTRAISVRHIDGQMFVAAEYVSGADGGLGSLADLTGLNVGPVEIVRWSVQFCSGLQHALSRGLVAHRDVKPANLLLTRDGDLKVADFGLGRSLPTTDQGLAAPGDVLSGIMGTPPYMAPEQIRGDRLDGRCDIYAFGVVLYGLCSGGLFPYELSEPVHAGSFLSAHLNGIARPLATPFWPIIKRCLERSPRDRWQTPRDFATAMRVTAEAMDVPCPLFVPPQTVGLEELYAKAQSLGALGRLDEALSAVNRYLDEAPRASWAWTEKGRLLLTLGRWEDSENATRRSLMLHSSNSHAWNNLGVTLAHLDRLEESISAYQRATQCNPRNSGAMMNAAGVLCRIRRFDDAATQLCGAMHLAPSKRALSLNASTMSSQMLEAQALDPAERVIRTILDCDNTNSQAWHNLGVIHAARGRPAEAIECVRTALRHDPDDGDTLLFLARLCTNAGSYDEALQYLDILIAHHPHVANVVSYKAQTLALAGRRREGIALLLTWLTANASDDGACYELCCMAEAEGDIETALRAAESCALTLTRRAPAVDDGNLRWAREKVLTLQALQRRDDSA